MTKQEVMQYQSTFFWKTFKKNLKGEFFMEQSILQSFYNMWVESAEYNTQSAVENGKYSKCKADILKAIGEKASYDISDNIADLACEAENAGFKSGLQYGIMFMSSMLKGGAV